MTNNYKDKVKLEFKCPVGFTSMKSGDARERGTGDSKCHGRLS